MSIKRIDDDEQENASQPLKNRSKKHWFNQKEFKSVSKPQKSFIFTLIITCFTVFMVVKGLGLQIVEVNGTSMYPELHNNQKILVDKPFWQSDEGLKRGDVIVFNAYSIDPQQTGHLKYVKRIIGVPGDKISFNGKHVYINGKPEDKVLGMKIPHEQQSGIQPAVIGNDHVINHWTLDTLSHQKSPLGGYAWNSYSIKNVTVPHGCYFVMGDHRKISNDSRYWGFVPANEIVGKSIVDFELPLTKVGGFEEHFA